MGVQVLLLGIGLQTISLDHIVRILHRIPLNIFKAPTLFTHAVVPFVFRRQVSVMIQESPSPFFPTASGISDRVTRRTHLLQEGQGQSKRRDTKEPEFRGGHITAPMP
jgi:hypothetical protein